MIPGQLALDGMPPSPGKRCDVCGGALALAAFYGDRPYTYVMRRANWVKIGKSKHPQTRLKELAAPGRQRYILAPEEMDRSEALELAFIVSGDVEHELHDRFRDYHARGEWFVHSGDLANWLLRMALIWAETVSSR